MCPNDKSRTLRKRLKFSQEQTWHRISQSGLFLVLLFESEEFTTIRTAEQSRFLNVSLKCRENLGCHFHQPVTAAIISWHHLDDQAD